MTKVYTIVSVDTLSINVDRFFSIKKIGINYYETICGGTGAGPTHDGQSAVHSHMTNTRLTDPEILEFRYPLILEEFSIRKGSGGDGKYKGGEGTTVLFCFVFFYFGVTECN